MMNPKAISSILIGISFTAAAVIAILAKKNYFVAVDQVSPDLETHVEKLDIQKHGKSTRTLNQNVITGDKTKDKISSAFDAIRRRGDYKILTDLLRSMTRSERYECLSGDFCSVESGFGFSVDIPNKIALINEFGENRSDYIQKKVLAEMILRIDPANDIDFMRSMDLDLWKSAMEGATIQNAKKAFELSIADVGIERQRLGVCEVLRIWLGSDSVAASEQVSSMPQGQLRDIAISKIIEWLVSKNCGDDAERWAESISDPSIRDKAHANISKKP